MKYINKINGYIHGYDNQMLFEGMILIDDEGWVEGILTSPNKDSKKFVFGFSYNEKVIELFGLALSNNNVALNFHVEEQSDEYNGQVLAINEVNQQLYGLCSLVMKDQELSSDFEVDKLEEKIESFKNNMDLYGKAFYIGTIKNKDRIIKSIIDDYNVNLKMKKQLKKELY